MVFQYEHILLNQQLGKEKWLLKQLELLDLKKALSRCQEELEGSGWNRLFWCNHNIPGVFSRWGKDKEYRVEQAKMLATLFHGIKKTSYIYQDEEFGMTNKRFDNLSDYKEINVMSQLNDQNSLFNYYKKLIKIRKSNPVVVHGKYKLILEENKDIFAYTRTWKNEKLLVICNFTKNKTKFVLEEQIQFKYREILISNYDVDINESIDNIEYRPYECRVHKFVLK